jgi:hypothetical protein
MLTNKQFKAYNLIRQSTKFFFYGYQNIIITKIIEYGTSS